jgi:hypothetical protein
MEHFELPHEEDNCYAGLGYMVVGEDGALQVDILQRLDFLYDVFEHIYECPYPTHDAS